MKNPDERPSGISESELEVLKILWEDGPSTAKRLRERAEARGRCWAHTTILTLLKRLEEKACVAVDRSEAVYCFSARVDRDGVVRARLDRIKEELCGGASSLLLQALFKGKPFSKREIADFKRLVDELDDPPTESKR